MRRSTRQGTPGFNRCAFCKHFYDPTNSAISPKRGTRDWWEYDPDVVKYCQRAMRDRKAQSTCSHFDSKI